MKVRLKAFAYHLSISAVVVAIALTLIFGFWYKPPFSYVQNVYHVVLTLLCVDLVVGPLLTFVVYNPQKKKLKMDLALIALMQVGALTYGLVVCYQSRPIYTVYNDGMFSTVMSSDYLAPELKKTPAGNPYLKYPKMGAMWVGSVKPANIAKPDELFIEYSSPSGGGLRLIPRFYVPYEQVAAAAARSGKLARSRPCASSWAAWACRSTRWCCCRWSVRTRPASWRSKRVPEKGWAPWENRPGGKRVLRMAGGSGASHRLVIEDCNTCSFHHPRAVHESLSIPPPAGAAASPLPACRLRRQRRQCHPCDADHGKARRLRRRRARRCRNHRL